MKDGMPILVTPKAVMRPSPRAGRKRQRNGEQRPAAAGWRCSRNRAAAVKNVSTIAVALAMAPTLRSISAVRITKVSPTAMIAVTETCCRMFSRLPSVAKAGRGEAEEADEQDQRRERRDVAQLIAQEAARGRTPGLGADVAIGHARLQSASSAGSLASCATLDCASVDAAARESHAAASNRSLLIAQSANSLAISPLRITSTRSASDSTVSGSVEKHDHRDALSRRGA